MLSLRGSSAPPLLNNFYLMAATYKLLRGLSAFPITPHSAAGVVNTDELQALVKRLTNAGVHSVGLLGSTGSYAYLSREERRRAIEASAPIVGSTPLLVGIGALRTADVVLLAQDAQVSSTLPTVYIPPPNPPTTPRPYHTLRCTTILAVAPSNGLLLGYDALRRVQEPRPGCWPPCHTRR